jgi:hypothetical protein
MFWVHTPIIRSLDEQFANLSIIKASSDRELFTRHGLHMNRRGKEQAAIKISTVIGNILKTTKINPEVQQEKQVTRSEKAIVGAVKVKVSSVSDTVIANADPPGITTSTPNKHEEPNSHNATVLDLNPSNLEGATFARSPNESKGNVGTSHKETTPILDLSQNSLEKSLLEKTDVINTLSSSDKSSEDSNSNTNKKATYSEPEIRDSIDPIDKEIIPQLDLNQINSEGLLLNGNNVVMDISTQHSKPTSVRTSNRKKQSPLTRNEDFLWK